MVGSSLHQRVYCAEIGLVSLRVTNAAALVIESGWTLELSLFNPMYGLATVLTEAAMMAAQVALGLKRKH